MTAEDRSPSPYTGLTIEEAWDRLRDSVEDYLIDLQYEADDLDTMLALATLTGRWIETYICHSPFDPPEYDAREIDLKDATAHIRAWREAEAAKEPEG